jgi:hypothetical protein
MIEHIDPKMLLKLILAMHMIKNPKLQLLLPIHLGPLLQNPTNLRNIIRQYNTGKRLHKHQHHGLEIILRTNIPKTHRQHNVGSPIVTPNILYVPFGCGGDVLGGVPGGLVLQVVAGGQVEQDGEEVRHAEVEE